MTLDELVVRVRVAVDEADGELDAVLSDLRRFAGEAAAVAGDAAAPQKDVWAGLAEAAKGAFSQVAATSAMSSITELAMLALEPALVGNLSWSMSATMLSAMSAPPTGRHR